MAYLKTFKRLLASKKVLRLLSTKLRLHKLQKSNKPTSSRKIKKRPTTTKSGTGWLSLSFQSRFKRKRKDIIGQRYPRKKTKAVYVDQLFLDKKQGNPGGDQRILIENAAAGTSSTSSSSSNKTGGGGVADDMWESLVMGSAQMEGINERAEEFISRFRADLLAQQITARQRL